MSITSSKSQSLKICVFQLEDHKWYIGSAEDVDKEYQRHKNGKGLNWTKIYRPVKLTKVMKFTSPADEDKITKEYMLIYGIDNVRGGSYCEEYLNEFQYESIQREFWMLDGACFICGRKGHFAKECKEDFDITGRLIGEVLTIHLTCNICGRSFSSYKKSPNHHNSVCDNCDVLV